LYGVIAVMLKTGWRPVIVFNKRAMKDIFGFGTWNFARSQIFNINEYADKFIIGKFLGPVLLGFYEKAFSTVALQRNSLTMQIDSVMFASFSRIQNDTRARIKNYLKKSICITSLIVFPVNVGLITLGTPFVKILLGEKWEPMILPMKILAVAFLFGGLNGLLSSLNIGAGSHVKQILSEGMCNVILVLTCLVAVRYGLEFIALSVFVNYILIFIISFHIARNISDIGISDLMESIGPAAIGSFFMALIIMPVKQFWLDDENMINFILLFLIGVIAYIAAIGMPKYSYLIEYRESAIHRFRKILHKTT
jgi:O-antigen/teichoic acid export membrane protein